VLHNLAVTFRSEEVALMSVLASLPLDRSVLQHTCAHQSESLW
jgi:hypothetical protein